MELRDAVEDDLSGIVEVISGQPLWTRYGYAPDRQRRDISGAMENGDVVVVAVEARRVLGIAWIQPEGAFGRSPYLHLIAARRGSERKGIGGRLLAAAEARVSGGVFLLVSEDNAPARTFYERHDYRAVGKLPEYVKPGIVEIVYWKWA